MDIIDVITQPTLMSKNVERVMIGLDAALDRPRPKIARSMLVGYSNASQSNLLNNEASTRASRDGRLQIPAAELCKIIDGIV